jgi:hypothetical protein
MDDDEETDSNKVAGLGSNPAGDKSNSTSSLSSLGFSEAEDVGDDQGPKQTADDFSKLLATEEAEGNAKCADWEIDDQVPKSSADNPSAANATATTPPAVPPKLSPYVRALYDFTPSEPEELAFRKGDVITVLSSEYKDWWKGSLNGRTGIFPLNYVERLKEPGKPQRELVSTSAELFDEIKDSDGRHAEAEVEPLDIPKPLQDEIDTLPEAEFVLFPGPRNIDVGSLLSISAKDHVNVPPTYEEKEEILKKARPAVLASDDVEMQLAWAKDALAYM